MLILLPKFKVKSLKYVEFFISFIKPLELESNSSLDFVVLNCISVLVEDISFILKGKSLSKKIFLFWILTCILKVPELKPFSFNIVKGSIFSSEVKPCSDWPTVKSL